MSSADTPDQILDAVQSVIVRDGVRGASMRQVAQEADVSVGLLSYHFDDKGSLIIATFDRVTTRLLEASVAAVEGIEDPEDRVAAFLRGSFAEEFLDGDYLRVRVSLWAVSLTDPDLRRVDAEFFQRYSRELRGHIARARPDLTPDEVADRTTDVIATSNGVWLNWARYGDEADLERGLTLCERIAVG